MLDLIFIALFSAAAGPAETAEPPPEQASIEETAVAQVSPAGEAEAQSGNVRRCRREAVTGSRMGIRVCTTRQQDLAAEEDAREGLRRASAMPRNDSDN